VATLTRDFSSFDAALVPEVDALSYGDFAADTVSGSSQFTVLLADSDKAQFGDLTLRHELESSGVSGPGVALGALSLEGMLRAANGFERLDWEIGARGQDTAIALDDQGAFASARAGIADTLFAPLLAKFERGLTSALQGGALAADATVRVNEDATNIIVPEARLRSATGETVLALSRVSYSSIGNRIVGNVLTAGADLPRITGRMEQVVGGELALRLAMEEYRAGSDWVAIPRLRLLQNAQGQYSFDGIRQAVSPSAPAARL